MKKKRVIIDTDPATGVPHKDMDDGLAILFLLACPEVTIEGLTINFGNVHAPLAYTVANEILEAAGVRIPVYQGSEKHTDVGTANPAVEYLIETVRKNPGEISLLAIAPLTNVASAMLLDPSFAKNLRELVIMGGTREFFAFNFFGEYNFHCGGKATKIVMESPVPKTLLTMELCAQAMFYRKHLEPIKKNSGSAVSSYLSIHIDSWLRSWFRKLIFRTSGFYLWDVVAAAALIDDTLMDKNPVLFTVRPEGYRMGSIIDFQQCTSFTSTDGRTPINMPTTLQADRFMELFMKRLLTL